MGSAAGELFAGTSRFEIRRRLGEGGFGVVYEAYDRVRRSVVALKTLRQTDPAALRQFKAEFRSLTDLVHPRLATLYELFCEDDRWFFTMKLIEGADFLGYLRAPTGARMAFASTQANVPEASAPRPPRVGKDDLTLDAISAEAAAGASTKAAIISPSGVRSADSVSSSGQASAREGGRPSLPSIPSEPTYRPDVDRLRPLVAQLAEGLVALHAAGMLHRDIKPSNVLVDREGQVIVLDFGLVTSLAIAAEDRSRSVIVGTPAYMAPEQALFGAVTSASDWYSVGVMLYEALTGCLPVEGDGLSVIVHKQMVDPIRPSLLARDVPEDLEELTLALLARKPEDRPTGAEVLRRLGARGSARPPAMSSRDVPFVGREAELAALEAAFTEVTRGAFAEVHVHGRSGIGKTALARWFLERAARRTPDLLVLRGRCYEQESVPFKAWDGIVDALGQRLEAMTDAERAVVIPPHVGALARLFGSLRGVDGFTDAGQAMSPDPREVLARGSLALRHLLHALAQRSPLVLLIDDMQWGDVDSARLLAEVTRAPDAPPMLLLLTYRSEDADRSPVLRPLRERGGIRSVAVSELSAAEGRALVEAIVPLGARDSEVVESVLRDASGSPFFIDEIARNLESYSAAERTAGVLDAVLSRRVAQLAPAARAFLEVVAVAGQPVPRGIAVDLAAIGSEEPAAIAALRAGRLVRSSAGATGEVETFHDRVREVVVAGLSEAPLRALHLALGRALEAVEGTDPERLAVHFEAGGEVERATELFERAADVAFEALGFDRAARLYKKAIDMRGADEPRVSALRARLGDALVNAGRGLEGARELVRAAQRAGRIEALDLRRRGAEAFMLSGHIDEGKATHKTVLDALGMRAPESRLWVLLTFLARRAFLALRGLRFEERDASAIDRERLLRMDTLWSLTIGMAIVDQVRALSLQAYHLTLALGAGEPSRIAHALAAEIAYCAARGTHSRARVERLLPIARALAERAGRPEPAAMVTASEGITLYAQARYVEAVAVLERAARMLRETCAGVTWHLGTTHAYLLFAHRAMGDVQGVCERYEHLRREAEERGDLYGSTLLATRLAHLTHLADDDAVGASAAIETAIARWSGAQFTMQHCYALASRVDCDLYSGDVDGGLQRLDATWPALARSLALRNVGVMIMSLDARARLLVARAKQDRADAHARARLRKDLARLRREESPLAVALVALLDAGVALADGDEPAAIALLEAAEARASDASLGLHALVARWRRGQLLGGDEGARITADAEAQIRSRGVARPERYTRYFLPV